MLFLILPHFYSTINYQVNFDLNKIATENLNFDAIKNATVDYLMKQPGISFAAPA